MRIIAWMVLGCGALAFGGREIYFPVSRYKAYHDFRKDAWGDKSGYSAGTNLLVGLDMLIDVVNISNITQSGTLEFFGVNSLSEIAEGNSCCPARTITTKVALCGHNSASYNASAIPAAVSWSVDAGKKIQLGVASVHQAKYGTNPNLTGMVLNLLAPLKITVNEDKGALLASFRVTKSMMSSRALCAANGQGPSVSGLYGLYVHDDGVGNITALNGGRPF